MVSSQSAPSEDELVEPTEDEVRELEGLPFKVCVMCDLVVQGSTCPSCKGDYLRPAFGLDLVYEEVDIFDSKVTM